MSILIKDIDMPKCSNEDIMVVIRHDKAEVWQTGYKERMVEAIQIDRPHGRLIDADNIDYDDFWYREGQGFTIAVCQGAQRIIEEQPTILEAEE